MERRKDIGNNLYEAAHQCGMGKAISKQSELNHYTMRKITTAKHPRWLSAFPGVDIPAKSPQGQIVPCSEKFLRAKSQTLQASFRILNVKVHNNKIRKRLIK